MVGPRCAFSGADHKSNGSTATPLWLSGQLLAVHRSRGAGGGQPKDQQRGDGWGSIEAARAAAAPGVPVEAPSGAANSAAGVAGILGDSTKIKKPVMKNIILPTAVKLATAGTPASAETPTAAGNSQQQEHQQWQGQ